MFDLGDPLDRSSFSVTCAAPHNSQERCDTETNRCCLRHLGSFERAYLFDGSKSVIVPSAISALKNTVSDSVG